MPYTPGVYTPGYEDFEKKLEAWIRQLYRPTTQYTVDQDVQTNLEQFRTNPAGLMPIYQQTQPGIMGQSSGVQPISPIQPPQSIQPLSAPSPLIQPPQSP